MSKVMGQKWLAGVVVAGFILVTPSVVWSQIAGRVQNGSGVALSDARVEIWDSYPGGSILASGLTNGSGVFSIGAVAGSDVDIRVRKANHYPTVVRNLPQPTSNTAVRLTATPTKSSNPISFCDYWDDTTTFLGSLVAVGDIVEVFGASGDLCGVGSCLSVTGVYLAHAFGDDPLVPGVDGPAAGENVSFKINGLSATLSSAPATFTPSDSKQEGLIGATSVSGVTLTGPTDATGSAGNSAFIVYSITNSGNLAGNFTLDVELTPGWTVLLSSQKALPLNLTAGETAAIVAEIQIPGGTSDQDVEVRARISSDTYGQANSGAWTSLAVSTTSAIGGDNGGGLLPTSFSLAQNYPNPFNAGTNITFNLDQSGQVSLTVCNLLGQSVRTLIDGHREVGIQTEVWDGRDDNGSTVPSGIYFSRLVQNDQRQVRKMVLLK